MASSRTEPRTALPRISAWPVRQGEPAPADGVLLDWPTYAWVLEALHPARETTNERAPECELR